MTGPLGKALIAHFDSVFIGPNGDFAAVLEGIDGLSARQAAWKPSPESNSIWQIVDHLTASKKWQIQIIQTGQAAPPVWTDPGESEEAWQACIQQMKDAHARLKEMLGEMHDENLLKIPVPEFGETLLELLLSSGSAHDAHHSGQIDYLKGLYGKIAGQ